MVIAVKPTVHVQVYLDMKCQPKESYNLFQCKQFDVL